MKSSMVKGARVTQKKKNECGNCINNMVYSKKVAEKMQRGPGTVSRYVHEIESAVGSATYILDAVE